MPLFEVQNGALKQVPQGSFAAEGLRERGDIQQWILKNPTVLGESLLVISEEFGHWEDSKRRIDLLVLDEDANLVVVELKRTDDGGHMELQALRYAAMISAMTFDDIVNAHERFLSKHEPDKKDEARSRILKFLGEDGGEKVEISSTPRIILLSADFSLEITTTVLWLIDKGIRIQCLQLIPYKIGEKLLLDLRQVIPLAQAGDYQIRLRQKEEATRLAVGQTRRELSLKVLLRNNVIKTGTEIEIAPNARPKESVGKEERRKFVQSDRWKSAHPRSFHLATRRKAVFFDQAHACGSRRRRASMARQ